jgi:hypothetical protein
MLNAQITTRSPRAATTHLDGPRRSLFRLLKIFAVALAAAMATAVLPPSGAFALNRVTTGYTDSSDFLRIYSQGLLCFANAGDLDVYITDIYQYNSGNNAGYIIDDVLGTWSFAKWQVVAYNYYATMSHIHVS